MFSRVFSGQNAFQWDLSGATVRQGGRTRQVSTLHRIAVEKHWYLCTTTVVIDTFNCILTYCQIIHTLETFSVYHMTCSTNRAGVRVSVGVKYCICPSMHFDINAPCWPLHSEFQSTHYDIMSSPHLVFCIGSHFLSQNVLVDWFVCQMLTCIWVADM